MRMQADDAEMYAQATIAAILTLGGLPQGTAGLEARAVVQRYKEVLHQLRIEGAWFRRPDKREEPAPLQARQAVWPADWWGR